MIVSASRRTDIPAFYSEWLLNRLKAGYVLVPNPRNPLRFSKVALNRSAVDCLVFWTKNPKTMLPKLGKISELGYPFYFQFTLTPYGKEIERNLPPKTELIRTFCSLSQILGPDQVVWRYDPVILSREMPVEYHARCFEQMAAALDGMTHRCIFSFLDFYPKVRGTLQKMGAIEMQKADMYQLAEAFSEIARRHCLQLFTCCEPIDLSQYGINHASCIDAGMIEKILGCPIHVRKDSNQRPGCGCVESVDIGSYDCCPHECRYCYATSSEKNVRRHIADHDPNSPLLFGVLPQGVQISEKDMKSICDGQMCLL
ncbi:DUF1848 domain-containing protein [Caproiciproducens sp. CPB-2]|uniref:DUF1848 domain-containing protein n=1 Tax=Caproiciproducens sp. CPB-2 TaxID=3030017 RepID=UPI0023DAE0D9|nr:DUF1848 domain-containing protein [Caproiciproducens sp. CPB-2]MDF1493184.1 DUF1848 domain-containing protein [Caproiciproducens sp. CPB-2]